MDAAEVGQEKVQVQVRQPAGQEVVIGRDSCR